MTEQPKSTPDFPLTLHGSGQCCKKIKGKVVYFGRHPDAALERYRERHCSERRIAGQGGVILRSSATRSTPS